MKPNLNPLTANASTRISLMTFAALVAIHAHAQPVAAPAAENRGWSLSMASDRAEIDQLQNRLLRLYPGEAANKNYNAAKAQCWLDTASTQWHENDRTGYVNQAVSQAGKIITTLEGNAQSAPMTETALIAKSDKLRMDLWGKLATFQSSPHLTCAAKEVACAEVRLVRAGHANNETGWRQANPHIDLVENGIRLAAEKIETCRLAAIPTPTPTPTPTPSPIPAATPTPTPEPKIERINIAADALFNLNKSDWTNMLPTGQKRLSETVQTIRSSYPGLQSIEVLGHTDRLGKPDYNQSLSLARAQTVKTYFASQGISAPIAVRGMASTQPVTGDKCKGLARTPAIPCLQPDRRIELVITHIK